MSIRTLYERHFNIIKTVPLEDREALAQTGKPKDGLDWRDKAVKEARLKHGKKFRSYEVHAERLTPPSRDLQEMNALSASNAERHTVTKIRGSK